MQPYVAFFRDSVPLRQLKVILQHEGYENIVINHSGNSLVFDTEQHGRETAVVISHILEDDLDEEPFVIVRSKVRLERLLAEQPDISGCGPLRVRFVLFDRPPRQPRMERSLAWANDQPGLELSYSREGAYLCLRGEMDRFGGPIAALSTILDQPALVVTTDMVEQAIRTVGEHETRLEASL